MRFPWTKPTTPEPPCSTTEVEDIRKYLEGFLSPQNKDIELCAQNIQSLIIDTVNRYPQQKEEVLDQIMRLATNVLDNQQEPEDLRDKMEDGAHNFRDAYVEARRRRLQRLEAVIQNARKALELV